MNGVDVSLPILRLTDIRRRSRLGGACSRSTLCVHAGACCQAMASARRPKILSGLDPPDHALVDYGGTRLLWPAARRRYRRDVIYLHQQAYLFDRSVTDNITYGLHRLGLSHAQIGERVQRALEWGGLSHLAGRNARELSGGEK
jgi:tungstate transport system ATP-binding protein